MDNKDPKLKELTQNERYSDARPTVPVLGFIWATLTMGLKELGTGKPRKRIILWGLAAQFDRLGLLTPITSKAKFLTNKICLSKVSWNDDLSHAIAIRW